MVLTGTCIVSSNHVLDEVYSMQHFVIKFVSDLRQGFLWELRFTPQYHRNIVECPNPIFYVIKNQIQVFEFLSI